MSDPAKLTVSSISTDGKVAVQAYLLLFTSGVGC